MPNTVTSPNMSIVVPVPSVETGPQWATDLYNALNSTVDAHDHSSGKGVQVTPAGLNISSDLGFGSNNATALRTTRYTSQATALSLGTDIGCLYNVLGDAYWNDAAGTQIQLTKNHRIAPSSALTTVLNVTGTLTILPTDRNQVYWVNTTSASVTINLPAASQVPAGTYYEFYDYVGLSETHNISFVPSGSDTINGGNNTNTVSQSGGSWRFITDGISKWAFVYSGIYWPKTTGAIFGTGPTINFQQLQQTSGAGHSWTFSSQASQASGNVNGGDFIFTTGAGNGSGRPGAFRMQGNAVDTFQFFPWNGAANTQLRTLQRQPWTLNTTDGSAHAVYSVTVPNGSSAIVIVYGVVRNAATSTNAAIFRQQFLVMAASSTLTIVSGSVESSTNGTSPFTSITVTGSGNTASVNVTAANSTSNDWQGTVEVHIN